MDKLTKLFDLLKELYHNGFFGEVVIKVENGNIVLVRKTESIKL